MAGISSGDFYKLKLLEAPNTVKPMNNCNHSQPKNIWALHGYFTIHALEDKDQGKFTTVTI